LLRAAPDGEGDWFQEGHPEIVRPLKDQHKGGYSLAYTFRVKAIIDQRLLPFLVDVGGLPQGEDQLDILRACTHSVLLYRTPEEYAEWQAQFCDMDLFPIAELQSSLDQKEQITGIHPVLKGTIQGLNRHDAQSGSVFGALLDRVAGICHYETAFMEKIHFELAPHLVLKESTLGCEIGISKVHENPYWHPENLVQIKEKIKPGSPIALYGRGPVWLAAAVSVYALPGPVALFDARYGWLKIQKVQFVESVIGKVQVIDWKENNAEYLEVKLAGYEVEPGIIQLPQVKGKKGLVLSGKLPRWYLAALAREFAPQRDWIGIDVPAQQRVVIIHSNSREHTVGQSLKRPIFKKE
jgi:CRISPR-associated protein Csx3